MKNIKSNSRILKAAETKEKIYESALKLFKSDGFGISVDSIVEAAGVSKGAFYLHYESKHTLIIDYVSTLDLDYSDYFSSLPSNTEPSIMLILVTEKIADVITNNIGFDSIKIIYEAQIAKTISTDTLLNFNRKLYQMYKQVIKIGVQQGEFSNSINIDSVSNHVIMSISGMTYEWCIRYPDFDLKDELIRHLDILLTGIKNS